MAKAKSHAMKYGDVDALLNIGLWYKYASTPKEKTAWHIIIKSLQKNPEAAPYLPKLPDIA